MKTPYDNADIELVKIFQKIKSEFNKHRLRIQMFDEIDILLIKKETNKLFSKLKNINQSYYLKIAQNAYYEICDEYGYEKKEVIDFKWLALYLSEINDVTNYSYLNELKRKKERFFEGLIASLYNKEELLPFYKKSVNFWKQQTEQFEISVINRARIQAFTDNGIKKIVWNTNTDGKECETCHKRNGQIFSINNIPSTHYYCRCYLTPL